MEIDFPKKLKQEQIRLGLKQSDLCILLHGVPLRTLQSWLHGEKLPPPYYQRLVVEKLSQTRIEDALLAQKIQNKGHPI